MEHASPQPPLNRLAFDATVHCLTGCAIGEVLGLVIATALGWHDLPSIVLAIVLAFMFGYALTMRPLVASGMGIREAGRTALAADTISIVVMEVTDTAIILVVPGAMAAGLTDGLFWEPRARPRRRLRRGAAATAVADRPRACDHAVVPGHH